MRLVLTSFLTLLAGNPAWAITLDELQGVTIQAVNTYSGSFRNNFGTAPGRFEARTQATIGPGAAIKVTATCNTWIETPKGLKTGRLNRSNSGFIGTPQQASDRSGNFLWVLDGDTLIRLRTFETGGNLLKITIAKTNGGLTCTAQSPILQEVGAGNPKDTAAMAGGGKVEILSVKQTGSSCRVSKK